MLYFTPSSIKLYTLFNITYQEVTQSSRFLLRNMLNSIEFTHKSVIQEAEEYINLITQNAVPKALTQQEIKEVTLNNTILQKVIRNVQTNKWTKDPQLQSYFKIHNHLSVKNNLLFKQNCIDSHTTDTTHGDVYNNIF